MTFTTPALLFPAISLLLLAYTNRFLVLARLIRELNEANKKDMREIFIRQLSSLRKRLLLIKLMQTSGVLSFLFCTFSMFALFLEYVFVGKVLFGMSLIILSISLLFSLYEIIISTDAINAELENIEIND